VLCCSPLSSLAQSPAGAAVSALSPEQVIQEGLRRQEERSREQQRALEPKADELSPDARKPAAREFPKEAPCVVINELALTEGSSARFGWLLDAALPYLRRCVGVKGLSFIAAELDGKLRDLGYATTRVGLPPQSLESGKLVVHVDAGRVAEIHMVRPGAGNPPDQAWGTWRNAFPMSAGDVLDIRDLEQGVENMKKLPSQSVATRLEPGKLRGTSILYIERQEAAFKDRIRGGVTIDNSGSRALGRTQLQAYLAFDNPAGLNDLATVGLATNAEQPTASHRSQSANIGYTVPWGYNLLSLTASRSRFAQYVQGTTVRFLSSGTSESTDAKLSRILWRTASSKFGLYGTVSTRRAISYLDDTEVVVQRRRTTNFETGVNYKHLLIEGSSFEGELSYRRGMPWQGAQEDFISAQDGGLTLRPRIWTVNAFYAADFSLAGRPIQYSANLRGQHTSNTTLSVDQISIGARSSVRGFDGDAVLLAENGVVLRNEFTTPVKLWDGLDTIALLAIDCGRVWGPSDILLAGKKLVGLALGLKGRWRATQFDATLATPLYRPEGFTSRRLSLYFSLTQSF
jgi:hemolysin activation/secretion protein